MWIIVGLGNPGAVYATSRHNAGFMAVDRLASRWGIVLAPAGVARLGRGAVAGHPAILVQPQTFMNRSGDAIADLDPAPDDTLLVVYDDLDLPAGQLRVRSRGGTAGHRGVASVAARLGDAFVRVRIGIGRPPEGVPAADYVLAPLSGDALADLNEAAGRASDAIESVLARGVVATMNDFNRGAVSETPDQMCKE